MRYAVVFLGAALIIAAGAGDVKGEPKGPDPPDAVRNATSLSKEQLAPTCKLLDFSCSRAVGGEYEVLDSELTFKKSELVRFILATVTKHIGLGGLAYYIEPGAKPIPWPLDEGMNPLQFDVKVNISQEEMMGKALFTWSF